MSGVIPSHATEQECQLLNVNFLRSKNLCLDIASGRT